MTEKNCSVLKSRNKKHCKNVLMECDLMGLNNINDVIWPKSDWKDLTQSQNDLNFNDNAISNM